MSASDLSPPAGSAGKSWPRPTGLALLVGSLAGLTDIALSLPARPSGFAPLLSLYPPMCATAAAVALVYLALWYGAVVRLARAGNGPREPLAVGLATFVLASFFLLSLAGLMSWPDEPATLFELALMVLVAAVIAVTAYFAWHTVGGSPERAELASVLAFASPFLLFEIVILEWAELYHIDPVLSVSSFLAFGLLGAALALTFRLVRRRGVKAVALLASAVFGLAFALLSAGWLSAARHETAGTARHDVPRVLLVSADTLRADALSSYREGEPISPNLDGLASEGALFERAYAPAPWTLASLASILTGLSPAVHTLEDAKSRLPDAFPTLAESLKGSGYHTAAIVLNDLLHPRSNLTQGFDDYVFLTEPSFGSSFGAALLQSAIPALYPRPPWPRTEDITRIALRWLEAHRDEDFFLWIHYYDPHAPYVPPRRYLPKSGPPPGMGMEFYGQRELMAGLAIASPKEREWIEALYRAEVRSLDEGIGALLDGLKRLELYDDTLIVFASDHGEELWDHGGYGHGHTLYEELLAVPLIIKSPGAPAPGRRVDARVPAQAITPTILDLCGIAHDPERYSSRSLAPLLRADGALYEPSPITGGSSVLFDWKESVIVDRFKYVKSMTDGSELLFDLDADPEEEASVARSLPEEVARARDLLSAHHRASEDLRNHYGVKGREEAGFDADTLRRLRGLGYVQ